MESRPHLGCMKRFLLFAAAMSVTGAVGTANAQAWLRDRAATQGPGIKAGDVEIHPGIGAEVGYDSNYFNRSKDDGPNFPVVDTWKLRITPSIYFNSARRRNIAEVGSPMAAPKFTFSVGGSLIYDEFLTNTDKLGRNREFGVLASALASVLPGRPVGLNFFETFQRTAQPALEPQPTAGLNRDENRVGGELVFTKPGNLFDWRFGYAYRLTHFESDFANELSNYAHEFYTRGRYRFLPRTALVYDGSVVLQRYFQESAGLSNSTPLQSRIGLAGLLTDRIGVTAMIGWGAAFYQNASPGNGVRDEDTVIGQAEFRYYFTDQEQFDAGAPVSDIAIGFIRDFSNSYLGNYYERNRGYVSISALWAQRVYTSLQAGIASIRYADVLGRDTGRLLAPSFTDGRVDATLFLEYRLSDWFGINATGQFLSELSNTKIPFSSATGSGYFAMNFNRFQAFAGVRAFY